MKKLVLIIFVLLGTSCAHKNKAMDTEVSTGLNSHLENNDMTIGELTSQKLQDYFELVRLLDNHPEFKGDILEQISNYSKDSTLASSYGKNFAVKRIRQVGDMVQISDTLQKVKLYFDVTSNDKSFTDSVSAKIFTHIIVLEGMETKVTRVVFSKTN